MKCIRCFGLATGLALLLAATSQAAFIVEAHSGLGNANFSFGGDTTSASASTPSAAVGLTGTNSLFGGTGVASPDAYVYSYTPGTDADNYSPAAGALLGSVTGFGTETASGVAGGGSGLYNVYFTIPSSTNVNPAGANFTLTQDGTDIVIAALDMNDGGTGSDLDPGAPFVGGANNAWYKLGTVNLSAGSTYSVTQEAVVNSFVSMRGHAIMWEAAVPEPSTLLLGSLAVVGLLARRKK